MVWTHTYDLLLKIACLVLVVLLGTAALQLLESNGYVFSGKVFGFLAICSLTITYGLVYHFLLRTLSSYLYARLTLKMPISYAQARPFNKVFTTVVPSRRWLPMTGLRSLPESTRYEQALRLLQQYQAEQAAQKKAAADRATGSPMLKRVYQVVCVIIVAACFIVSELNLPPASYLADAQAWLFGGDRYYPMLNALVLVMPPAIVLFLIEQKMRWR